MLLSSLWKEEAWKGMRQAALGSALSIREDGLDLLAKDNIRRIHTILGDCSARTIGTRLHI